MFLEVHTSFADLDKAKDISHKMIEDGLAACANLLPAFSLYRWAGKIASEDEVIAVFKTTEEMYPEFEKQMKALHPYEVPMIVANRIVTGDDDYLSWLKDSLRKEE